MSADRNYAIPLQIALASVRHNLPAQHSLDVTVLSADVPADEIRWKNKGREDCLRVVRPSLPQRSHTPISGHISEAAYFRLCLELAIDRETSRVIYLDCDLVVVGDISQLWEADLQGEIIGAVADYSLGAWTHPIQKRLLSALNQQPRLPYFNSGVLVIDMHRWRTHGVMQKAFEFLHAHPEAASFHDQDALNAVLCNNWHQLDPRWNRPSNYRWCRDQGQLPFGEDKQLSLDSPFLVHFVSGSKPWADYRHPDKAAFDRYASIAGYPDFRFTFSKALLRKAKSMLGVSPEPSR